jgi:hypothetical protein
MPVERFFLLDPHRVTKAQFYRLSATSGLLTTIAAGTLTVGHVFAARFTHASKLFHVTRLRVAWQTIAGFTAAQEVSLAAYKVTGFTVAHTTGGTVVAPLALAPGYDASSLAGRIGAASTITGSTLVIAEQILRGSFAELAAAATVQKGFIDQEAMNVLHPVCVLGNNEGILVRNEILMGSGGTGRLTVEIDGYERAA